MFIHRDSMLIKLLKIHYNASKLWMTGPQDYILQYLHEPEAGPEGGIKKEPTMLYIGPVYWPNSLNSCLQLQNFGCQGLRIAFSNTSMSLKLALRLVSKSTNNVFYTASVLNKISEIHVYSFKVLDARAQDCIFQHLLGPEACPEGAIKKYSIFFIELVCWPRCPKFMITASKLWMPGPQDSIFQHLHEPEAGPEGGIKKNQ